MYIYIYKNDESEGSERERQFTEKKGKNLTEKWEMKKDKFVLNLA